MIKKVHFIWVGREMRPLNQLVTDHNIKELESTDWEINLWTDNLDSIPVRMQHYAKLLDTEFLNSIRNHPSVLNTKDNDFRFPHFVDLIRYKILLDQGGLYCDTDDFLLCNPSDLIDESRLNVIQESARWITNSLIYAPTTNHPDLQGIWDWIMEGKINWNTWACTGPIVLTNYFYFKYEEAIKASTVNLDSSGWPKISEVIEINLYKDINIIPDTIFPIKWNRFHSMIKKGIPFDTQEYRNRGYKMLGMFGSVDLRGDHFPAEGTKVVFLTNHGPRDVMLGQRTEVTA